MRNLNELTNNVTYSWDLKGNFNVNFEVNNNFRNYKIYTNKKGNYINFKNKRYYLDKNISLSRR